MTTTKQRTSFTQQPLILVGPRVACRDCHAVFEDLSGHKLCDQCLCEYINGAGELELDDEIDFDAPRHTPTQAKCASITCRVCGLGATVPLDHPALLCLLCLEDLDGTRDRIRARLSAALTALETNQAAWDTLRAASPACDRWEAVEKALIGVAEKRISQATLDQTWAKRKAEGGALAELLTAYETYAHECDRTRAELDRLDSAQTEINAAWLATEI